MRPARRTPGFTLIELMIVVAILGVLASIALPEFQHLTLRARASERRSILVAVSRGVSDVVMNRGSVPNGGTLVGDWNPSGAPSTSKRVFLKSAAGWRDIPVEIEGRTYYSYKFVCNDHRGVSPTTLDTWAVGDLDGDGLESTKLLSYVAVDNVFHLDSETPAQGAEDAVTY